MNQRNSSRVTRRDFLRSAGAIGAALALTGIPVQPADSATAPPPESEDKTGKVSRLVPTICGMCDYGCGVVAYLQGNVLLKIEGNYNHSHSLGKICARGSAGVQLLYNPQRLKEPLKKNSSGRFEAISWDQALDEIASRLKQIREAYGPEGLAWVFHPRLSQEWDRQFMRAFGSPNLYSTRSVSTALTAAYQYTLGATPIPDLRNSAYILLLGHNPAESVFVSELAELMEAKEKGARVVVTDPRLSRTAAQAHEWMPIKPGTDGALLLAIMNVLVAEKLYDAAFVDEFTLGFEDLKPLLMDSTPGWASVQTGIPADGIRRLAREMAAVRPACVVVPSVNATLYENGVQTARIALALNALLGNYDAPGGLVMPEKPIVTVKMPATGPITVKRVDPAGQGAYPLSPPGDGMAHLLPNAILSQQPYPIAGLIVNGCNPVLSIPDRPRVEKALKSLKLVVVIDVQGTETSEMADYVLPESTYLERFDPVAVSQRLIPEVALRQPVFGSLYDTWPSHEIIFRLAERLDLGGYFPSFEAVLREQLRAIGTTPDRLEKTGVWRRSETVTYGRRKFSTPSGKIELYLERFKNAGVDPLPSYHAPSGGNNGVSLRLLHGREAVHTGSATQNIGWLSNLGQENEIWINAEVAAKSFIDTGDLVSVSSKTGQVTARARATRGIHPDAVFLVHGFGHNTPMQRHSYRHGVNDNDLINPPIEAITGAPVLCGTMVTLEKVR